MIDFENFAYDNEDEAIENLKQQFAIDGEEDREPTEQEIYSELENMFGNACGDAQDRAYDEYRERDI